MKSLILGSNITSLQAQRRLGDASALRASSSEKLSSGLRINKASDDAAGLAISASLNADNRVYGQAIRNVNDGISLLTIAEGALQALTSITTRQLELAHQSANGSLTAAQRKALGQEADALTKEFNRITESTTFNGIAVFDTTGKGLSIQSGYSSISLKIGDSLVSTQSTGTLNTTQAINLGGVPEKIVAVDVNNDGIDDMITLIGSVLHYRIGNGDGTFQSGITIAGAAGISDFEVGDLNNDGYQDVVFSNWDETEITAMLGSADLTFTQSYASPHLSGSVDGFGMADFNNDGHLDVITRTRMYLGNGDGSFTRKDFTTPLRSGNDITAVDINNDGLKDLLLVGNEGYDSILLGTGDGTTFVTGPQTLQMGYTVAAGDFNRDGFVDLIGSFSGNTHSIYFGNGDGSFRFGHNNLGNGAAFVNAQTLDINGDGILDVFATSGGGLSQLLIGRGDGTFDVSLTNNIGEQSYYASISDWNNDGAKDIFLATQSGVIGIVTNATTTNKVAFMDLYTLTGARESITQLHDILEKINLEKSSIGAFRSRLEVSLNNLHAQRVVTSEAASRITDVDVAEESSKLLRATILEQVGASILAQANQSPALTLKLLQF